MLLLHLLGSVSLPLSPLRCNTVKTFSSSTLMLKEEGVDLPHGGFVAELRRRSVVPSEIRSELLLDLDPCVPTGKDLRQPPKMNS